MKVFLGGTCNGSTWRNRLIPQLEMDYFNPVVEDWTPECMDEELQQRELCDYTLYVITPKMIGVYSIAEVVDDSTNDPEGTIFCVLRGDDGNAFTDAQYKSLMQVSRMVTKNGGRTMTSLRQVADLLNTAEQGESREY